MAFLHEIWMLIVDVIRGAVALVILAAITSSVLFAAFFIFGPLFGSSSGFGKGARAPKNPYAKP